MTEEPAAVAERYARRKVDNRYSFTNPEVWQSVHERQSATLAMFRRMGWGDLSTRTMTEVGCGTGGNLLEFLRFGFRPEHISGIELLRDRAATARHFLPTGLKIIEGDALKADVPKASQDVVFQAVVFSSLLDAEFQQHLADRMWSWVRPGGGVLWYDFVYDNPANADVRGVPLRRVRELFPEATPAFRRVTLAPPIARRVCKVHPRAYSLFNAIPLLRSHVLCWLKKAPI
jgi:SAM-dependent methyltransferase